jgi:uncharacterized protein DUF5666
MVKKFLYGFIFAAVALSLVLTIMPSSNVAYASGGTGKRAKIVQRVKGTVSAVDATSVTIEKRDGTSVTLTANATTKIERNDKKATLADLQVGDKVEARFNSTTMVASKIEAEDDKDD